MFIRIGAPVWPPPSVLLLLINSMVVLGQRDGLGGLGSLISSRDIAEITQIATNLAAQTMNTNSELLTKPGRPETRAVPMNARPSEMLGQTITNMMQPATEQLARALNQNSGVKSLNPRARAVKTELPVSELPLEDLAPQPKPLGGQNQAMSGLLDMANQFLGGGRSAGVESRGAASARSGGMPTLKQLIPGAMRNFGISQGDGCLPFMGEVMQAMFGNCAKQADERTWDVWGKEITNALMGGKIDLLRASKETCKKGAEREQCGMIKRAVSDCDILGSIQLASNFKRAIERCDEISGLIDQNPVTLMEQMGGFINGEVAQGFLNNFLGKKR
ncbi:unnamed protein product [Bursaphelenchus xylophilus]|uniref:(pine wood nematode) hypothetical protein n=1 Tax=Bursaphelenchus xylophilus TaxID=6326 RepID=A0A1I7RT16_BURXY|nr:unnamed protein product [Bursaphelenchus xylophilus]CAG9122678.1 unnamed protein product [Bursaphelenchus xylophilus]